MAPQASANGGVALARHMNDDHVVFVHPVSVMVVSDSTIESSESVRVCHSFNTMLLTSQVRINARQWRD